MDTKSHQIPNFAINLVNYDTTQKSWESKASGAGSSSNENLDSLATKEEVNELTSFVQFVLPGRSL